MVDFDALQAAGIANARDRAGLIEYLDGLGFTADEMVDAERRGRLFGLAGDVLQGPGRPTYSLRTAAEALGLPVDEVAHAWAALGLTISDPEQLALSQADVDGLATWVAIRTLVGRGRGAQVSAGGRQQRWPGSPRPGGTMVRLAQPDLLMAHSQRRAHHGAAYRSMAEMHPRSRSADRCRARGIRSPVPERYFEESSVTRRRV